MPVATIYWNTHTLQHACDVHGAVCKEGRDYSGRKIVYCTVCGARLVLIRDDVK